MGSGAKRVVAASLSASLICGLIVANGTAGAAKKPAKKKGPGTVDITRAINLPIPDRPAGPGATTPVGAVNTTITVGNQFRGKQIRDVNVTLQITGTGTNAINDVRARLTAPNGATSTLIFGQEPGNALGPLTLDDESPLFQESGNNAVDPQALYAPWIGSAKPDDPLFPMDGGPVNGIWTLKLSDRINMDVSVLNLWRLNVVAGRPFQTK